MKAAWYSRNGEARDVLVLGELPDPMPGPGEVRVRLATSGVNPSDVKSRRGRALTAEKIIPHSDGAGVIDKVGKGVSESRVGERVWVWNGQWKRPFGTACEFIALPQDQAVPLPVGVDFAAGACFGIPALTAIQAIRLAGSLQGRTVLVTGAGNAVGHYITQLAAMQGARVIGTAGSSARAEHARASGAHELINYKTETVAQRILDLTQGKGVDVILDMDFSTTSKLLEKGVLRPHGKLVGYGSNNPGDMAVNFRTLLWGSIGLKFFLVYDLSADDRRACIEALAGLLEAKRLSHKIGQTFSINEIAAAHEAVESGQVIGSVVLTLE
jgi:NADPH2:quinone reductase